MIKISLNLRNKAKWSTTFAQDFGLFQYKNIYLNRFKLPVNCNAKLPVVFNLTHVFFIISRLFCFQSSDNARYFYPKCCHLGLFKNRNLPVKYVCEGNFNNLSFCCSRSLLFQFWWQHKCSSESSNKMWNNNFKWHKPIDT